VADNLPTEADRKAAMANADFYSQCRGFSDFLLEQTKDARVFQEIAAAENRDGNIAAWLAKAGPSHGLPVTIGELDAKFRTWAGEQLPKPADRRPTPVR
jgi:hypothetical protein